MSDLTFMERSKLEKLFQMGRGAKPTMMVASAPQKIAPKLSNSLVHNPLWVNNRVRTAARSVISNFRRGPSC
jgi:hypothetical protein